MFDSVEKEVPASGGKIGIQDVLTTFIRAAMRDAPEIHSLALGDEQGLPIINATRSGVPVMTFTAMATMSLRAAAKAAEAVGLEPPDHLVVHAPDGEMVIVGVKATGASLIGLLSPRANLGLALTVLKRLSERIGEVLQE